jgi:hypothetical protein
MTSGSGLQVCHRKRAPRGGAAFMQSPPIAALRSASSPESATRGNSAASKRLPAPGREDSPVSLRRPPARAPMRPGPARPALQRRGTMAMGHSGVAVVEQSPADPAATRLARGLRPDSPGRLALRRPVRPAPRCSLPRPFFVQATSGTAGGRCEAARAARDDAREGTGKRGVEDLRRAWLRAALPLPRPRDK